MLQNYVYNIKNWSSLLSCYLLYLSIYLSIFLHDIPCNFVFLTSLLCNWWINDNLWILAYAFPIITSDARYGLFWFLIEYPQALFSCRLLSIRSADIVCWAFQNLLKSNYRKTASFCRLLRKLNSCMFTSEYRVSKWLR